MERNSSGALRAPGAFGATGTSDHHAILSSCLLCITGASGATRRVLRPHCDSAESGFIGRRRRLGRALLVHRPNAGAQALKLLLAES